MIINSTFDNAYILLLNLLKSKGAVSTTRKGEKITELYDQSFRVLLPMNCLAKSRKYSEAYLLNELKFYMSGSNSVHEAAKLSKFWLKCTDDGETINSNYGKLVFHDRNAKGFTQYEHALNCLRNNPQSKKAVMTLYNKENAYISNDNPCTMFLRARIGESGRLHLSVYMRSSDVFFGLPYDVPFFTFIQYCLCKDLNAPMGHYTHHTCSVHYYESKADSIEKISKRQLGENPPMNMERVFDTLYKSFKGKQWMKQAWERSKDAVCLKKHVGACLTVKNDQGGEVLVNSNYGGTNSEACKRCVRDDKYDKYYGDECPSIHAEMKCILEALKKGPFDFSTATIYVTHGPCDACLKLCDAVGIKKVVYDKPYKTNYKHWPRIDVVQNSSTPA